MTTIVPSASDSRDFDPSPAASPSPSHWNLPLAPPNSTSPPQLPAPPLGMSCITMVTGALSNLMALVIVGRARAGKRLRGTRARPYLQLASALLLHDLGAHLIPGALAMKLHARQRRGLGIGPAAGGPLCQLFGACMVYFGLSPLLLGGAMAMERCLGISRPLLHARVATPGHARAAVLMLCGLALLLALVPVLDGTGGVRYVPQFPGTWCFLPLHANGTRGSTGLGLLFSSLGLAALGLSLLCNTLSGAALLQRRLGTSRGGGDGGGGRRRAGWSSGSATSSLSESSRSRTSRWLDIEMMSQLAAITVVSCLCWSPFLVRGRGISGNIQF
ncbi:prostaglandin E2 receptor EP1 subtype-like isoform X2 [Denticeps clupeoides]|uniref:prostaglandin E2 receptor EP1 subtype-like isoform X2 n=1 Tax=Denticeps clupeoides TaxID=299321 RepID=UPI0010A39B5B|nr:prostaglandin E2 receptor EP1 subtype-like isoform X2 [Denticeps clupeoides]